MRTTRAFELASVPLLRALPPDRLEHLTPYLATATLARGSTLFREGDPTDTLWIVRDGSIALEILGLNAQRLLYGLLGPGDTVGELGLTHASTQASTALALAPTSVLRLPLSHVRSAFTDAPQAAWALCAILAEQIARSHDALRALATMNVTERVATQLCDLAERQGTPRSDGSVALAPGLTHETLAGLVGATRESVSRVMSSFRRRGLVRAGRGIYVLTNPPALQSSAARPASAPTT